METNLNQDNFNPKDIICECDFNRFDIIANNDSNHICIVYRKYSQGGFILDEKGEGTIIKPTKENNLTKFQSNWTFG